MQNLHEIDLISEETGRRREKIPVPDKPKGKHETPERGEFVLKCETMKNTSTFAKVDPLCYIAAIVASYVISSNGFSVKGAPYGQAK